MKKLLLLIAFAFLGCTAEDEPCHKCKAKFFDPETREIKIITSDCNHTPPSKYFVFVSHTTH